MLMQELQQVIENTRVRSSVGGGHARRQTLGAEGTASTSEEMASHQWLRCGSHVFAVKYFKLRFEHCFLRHNTIVASREAPIDYIAV